MREPVPYTPIWLMRQAGRYLPEYNETRARAGSFMGLAQNREYACEVTLQPLLRFDLDAAILFPTFLPFPTPWVWGWIFWPAKVPSSHTPSGTNTMSINWLCPICRACNTHLIRYCCHAKILPET